MDGAELVLDTESTLLANSNITGDGSLTLTGEGIKGSGRIAVTTLTVLDGTVDVSQIECELVQIQGGSVRTEADRSQPFWSRKRNRIGLSDGPSRMEHGCKGRWGSLCGFRQWPQR